MLLEAGTRVNLANKTVTSEPGEAVRWVYFPVDCIISVVKVMRNGTEIEVETVGREGLTAVQALLDDAPARALSFVQIAGEALRVPFPVVARLYSEAPAFRSLVESYVSALLDAMAQTIACNRLHYVSERCARWLLTTYDRLGRSDFALTHEALATMLGVRRAGVTIAAQGLQQAGWISYSRGRFTIVDPEGLATASCECYAAIGAAYARRRLLPAR